MLDFFAGNTPLFVLFLIHMYSEYLEKWEYMAGNECGLKWSSLLQRCHKLGADKPWWKSFESGPQLCHCFFSSPLRKKHLIWHERVMPFHPSSPGWFGYLFFTKCKNGGAEPRSLCSDLGKVLCRASAAAPVLWGTVTEQRKAATQLNLHSHPGPAKYLELHFSTGLEGAHKDHPAQLCSEQPL